jgi:UDP:flavonoid glycosyltransferase YjiC (YdhE family)
MATIIFKVLGTPSHYNATFKLAQKLMLKTHRIIYIGEESFKETIIRQGFEFYNNSIFHLTEEVSEENIIKQIILSYKIKVITINFLQKF